MWKLKTECLVRQDVVQHQVKQQRRRQQLIPFQRGRRHLKRQPLCYVGKQFTILTFFFYLKAIFIAALLLCLLLFALFFSGSSAALVQRSTTKAVGVY